MRQRAAQYKDLVLKSVAVPGIIVPGTEPSQDAKHDQKSEDNQVKGQRKSVLMDLLCQIRLETHMFFNSCSSLFASVKHCAENTFYKVLTLHYH